MHNLEEKLESTIGYLSGLERDSSSLQQALEGSAPAPTSCTDEQQAERHESSMLASTSEVQYYFGNSKRLQFGRQNR